MTKMLEKAFAEAAKLTDAEQDVLATRLLAELAAEDQFDRSIADSAGKLTALATDAIHEHREGKTKPLDLERP